MSESYALKNVAYHQPDYEWRYASECQRAWSWVLFSIPIIGILMGGLIWPYDDEAGQTNPLQPDTWGELIFWLFATLFYGLVWQQLYVMNSSRSYFHLIMSLPLVLLIAWFVVYHGGGMVVEGAYIMKFVIALLFGVCTIIGGLSDIPEWSLAIGPMLVLCLLQGNLNDMAAQGYSG